MSNFLRTLAERTVAPAREGKLQPRLASRFESGPLTAAGSTAHTVNGPEADAALWPRSVGPDFRTLPTEAHSLDTASATRGSRSHLGPASSPSTVLASTNPAALVPEEIANAFFTAEMKAPSRPALLPPPADRSTSGFASTLLVEPATGRAPTITPAARVGAAEVDPSADGNAASLLRPRSGAVPITLAGAIPAGSMPAPNAPPLPSAPAVRVHIGRVDIRAVHLPPAPTTPRPSAPERRPLLPLEDYLKRQDAR